MRVVVNGKGLNGVPTTDVVADLTGTLTDDGIKYSTAVLWGPLEATIRFTYDDAFTVAETWLGNPITIYGPDGQYCWEGRIWSVTYGSGSRKRTRSLDGYANVNRLIYDEIDPTTTPPTVTTPDKLVSASDGPGIALYGQIGSVEKAGQLIAAAANARVIRTRDDRKRIAYLPGGSGTLGDQSTAGEGIVELYCVGWYRYLFGRVNIQIATTGTADVTAIIQTILTGVSSGMISSDYSQMATTGTVVSQQQLNHEDAGTIIKRLVANANGYTFGLGPGRVAYLRDNGRSDATPKYIELRNGQIQDASGGDVALWTIQPGCVLRQAEMVPAAANFSATAVDNVECVYLTETTFQSPGQVSYKAVIPGLAAATSGAPTSPNPPAGLTGGGPMTTGSVPFVGASGLYVQDNPAFFWDATNKRLSIGQNVPIAPLDATLVDTSTTGAPRIFVLRHNTSGVPGTLFGDEIQWLLQSSTTADQVAARFRVTWVDATHATRTSRIILLVADAASSSREAMRLETSGTAPMIGFLGANAVVRQTLAAAATDLATVITLANSIRTALINLGLGV